MAIIHFLNVLEGDCNIIQHDSGRVSVIDVSNAYNDVDTPEEITVKKSNERQVMRKRTGVPSDKVDYMQKLSPDNPIEYLKNKNINSIFRFIITHPDMDHLDGIKDLFTEFKPSHTWDTNNIKQCDLTGNFGGYNKDDWKFYLDLRCGTFKNTNRLSLYAKDENIYWKDDNIKILSPTTDLIAQANDCDDYNDSSYVLLFTPPKANGTKWKILFAGDSHDKSWDYILKNFKDDISNVDILFAPHHGRDSERNYDFLKILNPKITLFGNASAEHLAYTKYPPVRITNNQAGYVIINCGQNQLDIYVKNFEFMRDFRSRRGWELSPFNTTLNAYFLKNIK